MNKTRIINRDALKYIACTFMFIEHFLMYTNNELHHFGIPHVLLFIFTKLQFFAPPHSSFS